MKLIKESASKKRQRTTNISWNFKKKRMRTWSYKSKSLRWTKFNWNIFLMRAPRKSRSRSRSFKSKRKQRTRSSVDWTKLRNSWLKNKLGMKLQQRELKSFKMRLICYWLLRKEMSWKLNNSKLKLLIWKRLDNLLKKSTI